MGTGISTTVSAMVVERRLMALSSACIVRMHSEKLLIDISRSELTVMMPVLESIQNIVAQSVTLRGCGNGEVTSE